MSAISPIVLPDFLGVDSTFNPVKQDTATGVITYIAQGVSYDAKPTLTILSSYPKAGSTRVKQKIKVSIPIMDTVDTTKKVDEVILTLEVSLAKNSVLATRNNLYAYAGYITQHDVFREFIQTFDSPF